MRRIQLTIALTVMALVAAMGAATAQGPTNYRAHLSGDNEVPPVDTNAQGQTVLQLAADGESMDYRLNVANIENVLMAHLHVGPPDANGPVVVWLYPEDGPPPALIEGRFDGTLATGTITESDLVGPLEGMDLDALIAEMDAGNIYVNVHTEQNPGGEIRGQVH